MITAIDTNILLDILLPDARFVATSKALLDEHKARGQLVICEIVYAEIASQFPSHAQFESFLSETAIATVPSSTPSLALAGRYWKEYVRGRDGELSCSRCGARSAIRCPECATTISVRQHIISDFIIGAHAYNQADLLLSRDRGFYRSRFDDLTVLPSAQ